MLQMADTLAEDPKFTGLECASRESCTDDSGYIER